MVGAKVADKSGNVVCKSCDAGGVKAGRHAISLISAHNRQMGAQLHCAIVMRLRSQARFGSSNEDAQALAAQAENFDG
jgi:hypothetical protein